jgi:hypothetical protein
MIIIYEPADMNERARSNPAAELTLHDVHPQEFEIRFIKLD